MAAKKLTADQLRKFRSDVSALKKQGLIKASIDARKAKPHFLSKGKPLLDIVRKNKSKIPPKKIPVPKPIEQTNLVKVGSNLVIEKFNFKHKSLAGMLRDMKEHAAEIDALKREEEYWGVKINGIKSYSIYDSVELIADEYLKYEKVSDNGMFRDRKVSREFAESFTIVRWNKSGAAFKPGPQKLTKNQLAANRQARARNAKRVAAAKKKAAKKGKSK